MHLVRAQKLFALQAMLALSHGERIAGLPVVSKVQLKSWDVSGCSTE
jgi:hypothetical protein